MEAARRMGRAVVEWVLLPLLAIYLVLAFLAMLWECTVGGEICIGLGPGR